MKCRRTITGAPLFLLAAQLFLPPALRAVSDNILRGVVRDQYRRGGEGAKIVLTDKSRKLVYASETTKVDRSCFPRCSSDLILSGRREPGRPHTDRRPLSGGGRNGVSLDSADARDVHHDCNSAGSVRHRARDHFQRPRFCDRSLPGLGLALRRPRVPFNWRCSRRRSGNLRGEQSRHRERRTSSAPDSTSGDISSLHRVPRSTASM